MRLTLTILMLLFSSFANAECTEDELQKSNEIKTLETQKNFIETHDFNKNNKLAEIESKLDVLKNVGK